MTIKIATEKDVNRISYLIRKVTDINPNKYSKNQIKAWKQYNTPSKIKKQLKDRVIFCAFEDNRLLGTIALKANYILGFYVSQSIKKRGIGTKLLTHAEAYAENKSIKKLYLTSTPSALEFYKNRGYNAKRMLTLSIFGVDYPEVEMEKCLI